MTARTGHTEVGDCQRASSTPTSLVSTAQSRCRAFCVGYDLGAYAEGVGAGDTGADHPCRQEKTPWGPMVDYPLALLQADRRQALGDALFAASRHWGVSLHLNKGLAGAALDVVAAARDTAMNPAVLDAFALVICAAHAPPAYPGVQGHEPDVALARQHARAISSAMNELRKPVPDAGSYVSESNFFEPRWQQSFWGSNYPRLLAVKKQCDPDGLFFVHHGVGSEDWSADGFTKLA